MAFNPHSEQERCSTGGEVPAGSVYFRFNGWPYGVADAAGGLLGGGEVANEEALCAALERATLVAESGA